MAFPDSTTVSGMTALQPILKSYYSPEQVKSSVYKRNRLLALLHKEEGLSGEVVIVPVIYGNPQGASATFSSAQANITASKATKFTMNWAQDYALARITGLVMKATRNDAGAFVRAARNEIDGALKTAENRLAGALFRKSTGTIGTGTISSGVITLTNAGDVTQIEVGQQLHAAASDGGAALGSGSVGYVISVDRAAGTFTVEASVGGGAATPASWTGTMYFRTVGDLNLKINGLADWLPTSAPSGGENYNGVDRSKDATRLAGVRWDGSAQTIEEAAVDAAALCAREDGNPELGITNHATWAATVKALGSKIEYVNFESDEVPGIGFKGVKIHGADGEINLFADRSCQSKRIYLLDPDFWTLGSMGPCPDILTPDGLDKTRVADADAVEVRIGSYVMLYSNKPGASGVIVTSA